ncbi:hypothetical protein ACFFX0_09450 [Citricoccus parietis]|uniref:Uncharacterized protein n=1 Tax=Citricoccus parietis TaxID=592307 RepID=A0ABV5FXP8_9MICC
MDQVAAGRAGLALLQVRGGAVQVQDEALEELDGELRRGGGHQLAAPHLLDGVALGGAQHGVLLGVRVVRG